MVPPSPPWHFLRSLTSSSKLNREHLELYIKCQAWQPAGAVSMFDDIWLAAGNADHGGGDTRCALHSLSYAACPELLQGMGGRREARVQEQVFTSSQTSATLVLSGACTPLCNTKNQNRNRSACIHPGIGTPSAAQFI